MITRFREPGRLPMDTTNTLATEVVLQPAITGIRIPQKLRGLDVVNTAGGLALFIRGAQGNYYHERTATGAETHYFSTVVPLKELTAGTGYQLTGIEIAYYLATVNATTIDVRCDSTVYAQGVAPAVTASHGGAVVDGDYDANHNTAAKRADSTVVVGEHLMTLTLNTPAYYTTAAGIVRAEFQAVLANTGVLRLRNWMWVVTHNPE